MLNDSLHPILEWDHLGSNDSDITMVAQYKKEISELQHMLARLQSDNITLTNENTCLNMKCNTLQ